MTFSVKAHLMSPSVTISSCQMTASPLLTNGDAVVIVDSNQVAQLQVTSQTGSLAGNALHGATVTEEAVGVVVDEVIARLVEDGSGVSLGNSKAHRIGEALTQGTGGDLDARSVMSFGMTRGFAAHLLENSQSGCH